MVSGHYHSYERSCPIESSVCQSTGTVHTVVGTAGASLDTGPYGAKWSRSNLVDYAYSVVSANRTHLHFQLKLSSNRSVYDEFILEQ